MQNIIEKQFATKVNEQSYGIYVISEGLGRGTDFTSSNEIESRGGIYLLIASVFNSSTTEQIKGRVGRLMFRGQVQYCVCTYNSPLKNNFITNNIDVAD